MSAEKQPSRISAVRLALAVKRLRAETAGIDLLASEPIALVGMGCRFPGGADDSEKFWKMLRQGVDGIRRVPDGRWPDARHEGGELPEHLRHGGFLEAIDGFDAAFFGITPREAQAIDPQQRLLLEVTWEAMWNAGTKPESMSGQAVGVFAAISNTDYSRMELNRSKEENAPNAVHAAHSIAAGRISFLLNLRGPCMAVDTACSSSLVAVHLACQSLRMRECDMAISGGVSMKVLPDELLLLNRLGVLSKSSRCATFDAKADGFVVGEGCGVVVLKRLADALAAHDPIRAVIRGTAVNHDGRTTVLTAPSGLAHEAVIRQALKNGAIEAEDVSFVETHGTGTALGDPIELMALEQVYGAARPDAVDCVLGAVKTNLGHLEAAAGFAGLIKTVLALEEETIPRNLHFSRLNPQSSIEGTRLKIAASEVAWPRGAQGRFAGISSLGLNGTNAHVIVEEAPLMPGATNAPLPLRVWQRQSYWLPTIESRDRLESFTRSVMDTVFPAHAEKTMEVEAQQDGFAADSPIEVIERRVQQEAAAVMGMTEDALAADVPLISLGLDSMMALDLRQRLRALIHQELPNNFAFDYQSVSDIAREVAVRVWATREAAPAMSGQAEEVEI